MPELADSSFSFILFSNNGIDCLSWADRQTALKEIRRVLAPSGWLVFASHNLRGLPIPKPWHLSNLMHAWSAANLLRRIAMYPIGIANYLRLHSYEQHLADHALIHDAGEGLYNLFQIYIAVEHQIGQLAAAGLTLRHVIGLDGKILPEGPERQGSRSLWLTYVCHPMSP